MKNKLKTLTVALSILLTANFGVITQPSMPYITTMQELEEGNATQLLRVAVDKGNTKNSINVYLFTSDSSPIITEKVSGSKGYIVELNNTITATTDNINLIKVSDTLENVKIIPYLNISNPSKPGMTKVLLFSKIPNLKYNVILRTVNVKNNSKTQISSKVYSPKSRADNMPQNMSFFTPIDDKKFTVKSIDKSAENKLKLAANNSDNSERISSLPNVIEDNSLLAQSEPVKEGPEPKLTVAPPANAINTNDLIPEDPDPEKRTLPNIPNDDTDQVGESPLPKPNAPINGVETWMTKDIALGLIFLCLPSLILIVVIAFIVYKKMKKAKGRAIATQLLSDAGIIQDSHSMKKDFSPDVQHINEHELLEPPVTSTNTETSNLNYNEDVEEIDLIDSVQLTKNKTLYLIRFSGNVSLIASVNEDVTVLITFTDEQVNVKSLSIKLNKEGNVLGKEMFLAKIGHWEGVIASDNGNVYLQANLK